MAVTFNVQIPGEAAVAVTLSTDAVQSITAFITASASAGILSPGGSLGGTTLPAPVAAPDLTMQLSSTAGLQTGMGLLIGTEISLVTGISNGVANVVRARIGTAAAAYPINTPVTFVRSGSYGEYVANLIGDQVRLAMTQFPGPAVSTANAAIAVQQAAIASAVAGAVTHTP